MGVLNPSVDVYIRSDSLVQDTNFSSTRLHKINILIFWHVVLYLWSCFGTALDHAVMALPNKWPVACIIAYMIEFELGDC